MTVIIATIKKLIMGADKKREDILSRDSVETSKAMINTMASTIAVLSIILFIIYSFYITNYLAKSST